MPSMPALGPRRADTIRSIVCGKKTLWSNAVITAGLWCFGYSIGLVVGKCLFYKIETGDHREVELKRAGVDREQCILTKELF